MERNKIIAIAVLALGIVGWRMGAMQREAAPTGIIKVTLSDDKILNVPVNRARLFDYFDVMLSGSRQWEEKQNMAVTLPDISSDIFQEVLNDLDWVERVRAEKRADETEGYAAKRMLQAMLAVPLDMNRLATLISKLDVVDYLQQSALAERYAWEIASMLKSDASMRLLAANNAVEIIDMIHNELSERDAKCIAKYMRGTVWVEEFVVQHDDAVDSVAISADGNRVVAGSSDNSAKILERSAAGTWQQVRVIQHDDWVLSVAISADGNRVVTGSNDHSAKILERNTAGAWQQVHVVQHGDTVNSVAISADGNRVVTGSYDRTAKILERNAAGLWQQVQMIQHDDWVLSVAISADGTRVVTGSNDHSAKILERNTAGAWQQVHVVQHGDTVNSVAISADGNRVVTGSYDRTAKILERNAAGLWQQVQMIQHGDPVPSVAISADGNRVVTGSSDHSAKILERDAAGVWQQVQMIQYGNVVYSVAISADGNRVVTGSNDETAKILERDAAGTWQQVQVIQHDNWVRSVAVSADGNRVVTGSWDNTAKIVSEVPGSLPGVSDLESSLFVNLLDWAHKNTQKISKAGWVGEILRSITWRDVKSNVYKKKLQSLIREVM